MMKIWGSSTIEWRTATSLHIGGRDEQQDRSTVVCSADGSALLAVIADGMGGLKDGAKAAQSVVDVADAKFTGVPNSDPLEALSQIINDAHCAINGFNGSEDEAPGSTCVLLLLQGETAYWAHVGDSRLYHFRDSNLLERTKDHSVAQLLIEKGALSEHEAAASPLQNQLHRRLGGPEYPKPDFNACKLQEGDTFMLCSDGFWGTVQPEENIEVIKTRSLAESADFLTELAMNNGGAEGDNIALTLVAIDKIQKLSLTFLLGSLLRWIDAKKATETCRAVFQESMKSVSKLFKVSVIVKTLCQYKKAKEKRSNQI